MPAASEEVSAVRPVRAQSPSWAAGAATVSIMNNVDPYISIVSPTSRQPAL
jgi:hypothetical protein